MSTFIRYINCTNWINIRLWKIFHVCIFNQSNGLGVNLRPSSKSVFRHPLFRVFKWCFLLFYFLCTIYTYTYLLGGNQGLNSGVHYFWFKIFNNRNWFNLEQIVMNFRYGYLYHFAFSWINNKQSLNQFTSH